MNKQTDTDRFGFSEEYLSKVFQQHNSSGVIRSGCYIPTKEQVRTMAPEDLVDILIDWLWESPSELIPTDEQIQSVHGILLSRPDQEAVKRLVFECDDYLNPN